MKVRARSLHLICFVFQVDFVFSYKPQNSEYIFLTKFLNKGFIFLNNKKTSTKGVQ